MQVIHTDAPMVLILGEWMCLVLSRSGNGIGAADGLTGRSPAGCAWARVPKDRWSALVGQRRPPLRLIFSISAPPRELPQRAGAGGHRKNSSGEAAGVYGESEHSTGLLGPFSMHNQPESAP